MREMVVEAAEYSRVSGSGFERLVHYEGVSGAALLTGESGMVEWTIQVEEAGMYHLS
ncbi:hypothetical protein D3C80_2067230 [compost metagenome]